MIDFDKQPLCEHCCFCVGWAYPRGEQECSAGVRYKEDGSCCADADFVEQMKQDAYDDYCESDDDDDYYEEEEEPEEEQEDEE